jgi:hypothetical protein
MYFGVLSFSIPGRMDSEWEIIPEPDVPLVDRTEAGPMQRTIRF